jgi:hypothetical protein
MKLSNAQLTCLRLIADHTRFNAAVNDATLEQRGVRVATQNALRERGLLQFIWDMAGRDAYDDKKVWYALTDAGRAVLKDHS